MKKKFLLITIAILFLNCTRNGGPTAQVKGTFTDKRDGQVYNTIKIGTQTWMAENLKWNAGKGCWSYNWQKYGYLYNWETAKKSCPMGWHLPSDEEWTKLTTYLGESNAGYKMRSKDGWLQNSNGSNSSGFTALPGGYRDPSGEFYAKDCSGYFWSATQVNAETAYYRSVYRAESKVNRAYFYSKATGLSVRCVRDY